MKPYAVARHRLATVADRPVERDCPTPIEIASRDGIWIFTCCFPKGHLGECDVDLPRNPRDWWPHQVEPQGPRPEGDSP